MKRIIYILTAIFSAVAAAIFITDYISAISQYQPGEVFFNLYRCPQIAAILALCVLSVVQLKKHTPRIVLLLCGYVFYEAALMVNGQYLFGLLLMAAALMPAIYEFSNYGMMVKQEPEIREKIRWLLIAAFTLALALCAYRVMLSIMQAAIIEYDGYMFYPFSAVIFYPSGIIGIAVLLCAAVFCALMNRRTSVLYRMFLTGCIAYDALRTFLAEYNNLFSYRFLPDTTVRMYVLFEAVYALLILLIFIHALLTRRGVLISPIKQAGPDLTAQAEMRS